MATIGSIGIGLFIVIIAWIIALGIFVVSVKYQSNIGWISLASAAILTVVLVSIPTESQFEQEYTSEVVEKDYHIVYKKILLAFIVSSGLIAFLAVFIFHCLEPIRIKPVKGF